MADVGSFIIGAVVTTAGILVTPFSGPLGAALISVGSGQLLRGLFGTTSRPSHRAMQSNLGDPDATLPVVYGEGRIGFKLNETWVDPNSQDREELIRGGVMCVGSEDGNGIESVEKVWLDDVVAIDPVTTGNNASMRTAGVTSFFSPSVGDLAGINFLQYLAFRGTDAQTVPTALNAKDATRYPSTWRNRGLAYIVMQLEKSPSRFPRAPNGTALVRGNRVYDPRDPTGGPNADGWIWDKADATGSPNQHPGQNPALCLLDYMASVRYGWGLFYPERDGGNTDLSQIDEQSFIDAANYCDELVQDGSGGTQPRFQVNGWLDTGNTLTENRDALLAAMRGKLVWQNGKARLFIRQQKSSALTLTTDDLIGDWEFRRGGSRKVPNRVIARYAGGDNGEITEDVEWPASGDTTFEDQDAGHVQTMHMDLPLVDDPVRAQQIAMVDLREAREDTAVRGKSTGKALQLEAGDVVTIDHETPGWTGGSTKDFWVLELSILPGDVVELTLKEYDAGAYSLDPQTRPTDPPGSNLPDPTSTGQPTNLQLTSDSTTQNQTPAGDKIPGILATWDLPTDVGIDRVVVLERENGTSSWNTARVLIPSDEQRALFVPDGGEGDTWEVGVYVVVGQRLVKSSVTTGTVVLDTDFVASDVLNAIIAEDTEESDFDADGVVEGRLTVEIIAASGSYDFKFYERQGRGAFPGTASSTATGLTNGQTASHDVDLPEKTNAFIKYEVFEGGTSNLLGRRVVTFDPDDIAEVEGIDATIDPASKNVVVSASGDSDADSIHVRVGLNADPADPDGTVSDDGTITGRSGSVDTGVTASDQDIAHIKARGENTAGGLGPVKSTRVALASGARVPAVDEQVSESGSTGSLDLAIEDPETRVTAVEFQKKTGSGDWGTLSTAWDRSTGTPGSSTTLTRGEDVTLVEKHNVSLRWKVTYTEPDGSSAVLASTVTFDVDNIAEVNQLALDIDASGTLSADVAGDSDTAKIYLTHTKDGTEPSDPTSGNQDQTISARSGSVTFSGTVAVGNTAWVKARGENSSTQLAPAATIKEKKQERVQAPDSSVNLLGQDAGPEHSGTELTFHTYKGFESGGSNLASLGLDPGDVISIQAQVKSATGADSINLALVFQASSGATTGTGGTPGVTSSTYQAAKDEDITIPPNTVNISLRGRNDDQTETGFIRRAMLNRGPVAAPFSPPPAGDLISGLSVRVDSSGNVLVSGRKRGDAGDVHITVGNGSPPSDPTSSNADKTISTQTWSDVDTTVDTTPLTVVFLKAQAETSGGTLSGQIERRVIVAPVFSGADLPRTPGETTVDDYLQRIRADGHIASGARIDVGGTLWNLTRARQDGSVADGGTVTFPTSYPTTPKTNVFGGQGISSHADFEASTQFPVMRPDTLDNQGFEMVGELQDRSAQSLDTDTFPAGTLSAQGDALSLAGQTEGQNGGSGLTGDAVDDSYSTEFSVSLSVTDSGSPPGITTSTLDVTVAVDKWDSDDGVWQEAGTIDYSLSATSGNTDSINRTDGLEFTDSGVVSGDDIRVRIKSVTVTCGSSGCTHSVSVDPVETTYNVATTDQRSMSPNSEKLEWVARMEVS